MKLETFLSELIVALWWHKAWKILINIGSGIGLKPNGTQLIPEPMLVYRWAAVPF